MKKSNPLLFLAGIILILDRLTKWLAVEFLSGTVTVPIIPEIFHLTLVHNSGVAFGLFAGQRMSLIVLTSFIVLGLFWVAFSNQPKRTYVWTGLGLILGGALSNLGDRIFVGAVIDFLDFRVWPVFNIADSAITVGACLLALDLLKEGKRRHASGSV